MGPPRSDGDGGSGGAKPPVKLSEAEGTARRTARPPERRRGMGPPRSDGDGGAGGAKPPGKEWTERVSRF